MEEEHKQHEHEHHVHHVKKKKYDYWKIATFVLAIAFIISLSALIMTNHSSAKISKYDASNTAIPFINTYLLQGQAIAELTEVNEEMEVYGVKTMIQGNEVLSYVSADGQYICPQAINIKEFEQQIAELQQQTETIEEVEIVKSAKPTVELFIMSHCPYGTQAEKGIIPAVEALGDSIDFEIKFVHYAMHNDVEVKEQIRQYCIMENNPQEFMEYLKCFLESGASSSCMGQLDEEEIEQCVLDLDEELAISENYPNFPLNAKESQAYGVQGSPTLVINGEIVNSGRSPQQYLTTICSAFDEQPETCNAELSTETYSAGFGYDLGTNTGASC
jgi:hypothetical protein